MANDTFSDRRVKLERSQMRSVNKQMTKVCLPAVFVFAVVVAFMVNYTTQLHSDEPICRAITQYITGW